VEFAWDERAGDTVERDWLASGGPFKPLADALTGWNYHLAAVRPESEAFAEVWDVEFIRGEGSQPAVKVDSICHNSYGNNLVFSVSHAVKGSVRRHGVQVPGEKKALSGPIYFLPETDLSEEEALEFVLRDLCGVDISAPEPEWVVDYVALGQEVVDHEIDDLKACIAGLIRDLDLKVEERAEVRAPLKLLHETGPKLEEAVLFVLEALGAEVERPVEGRNQEDGWVKVRVGDEICEGVLEVKGVKTKHFGFEGLRQLTDWIYRGINSRTKKYTGIFVGNNSRHSALL
jgi:hypothetical protein